MIAPTHIINYCRLIDSDSVFSEIKKKYESEYSFVYKITCSCGCNSFKLMIDSYSFLDIYEWAYHHDGTMLSGILHSYHEDGLAQEYLMKGSFNGTLTWSAGETAYSIDVLEQIKDTMEYWQTTNSWENSNEYDRFIEAIS